MLSLSHQNYYLGEIFNPDDKRLDPNLLQRWFLYIPLEEGSNHPLYESIKNILTLNFTWPNRKGLRRFLPSRLKLFRITHKYLGLPRPILKDPIAVFSAEWLAEVFRMNVVCLIRHPAAFVHSIIKANWGFGFSMLLEQTELMENWLFRFEDQLSNPPADLVMRSAILWSCIYTVITAYLQRNKAWVLWRLEDISQNPIDNFEIMFNQLNIRWSNRIKNIVWDYSKPTNPIEAPQGSHGLIKRDSRSAQLTWRNGLTKEQIHCIRQIVEPVSYRYYSDIDW
jgi:hypothetical protein